MGFWSDFLIGKPNSNNQQNQPQYLPRRCSECYPPQGFFYYKNYAGCYNCKFRTYQNGKPFCMADSKEVNEHGSCTSSNVGWCNKLNTPVLSHSLDPVCPLKR